MNKEDIPRDGFPKKHIGIKKNSKDLQNIDFQNIKIKNTDEVQSKFESPTFTDGFTTRYGDLKSKNGHLIDRQKQLAYQSHIVAEASMLKNTDRMSTEQMIPSFRTNFELYEMLLENNELKQMIQIKNKQIFYLSTQIVSVKQELSQKIIHMEQVIAQKKNQITELRYENLKRKREQNEKFDKLIEEQKKNYEFQIHNIKEVNAQILKKQQQKHRIELQNIQQKYRSILNLQKAEKSDLEKLSQQKNFNLEGFVKNLEMENKKLALGREQEYKKGSLLERQLQRIKQQFKNYSDRISEQQKTYLIQIENLKAQIFALKQEISQNRQQRVVENNRNADKISQLQESFFLAKKQNKQLKQLVIGKDKQIEKLIDDYHRKNQQRKQGKLEKSMNLGHSCNHEGLIRQLERNIQIKNKENSELRQQLNQWGKYIGFDKRSEDRFSELLESSSQALILQQNFSNSIRKRVSKYNS